MATSAIYTEHNFLENLSDHSNKLILDSINEGVGVFERDATILYVNKHFAERFGRSVQECIGTNMADYLPQEKYGDLVKNRLALLAKVYDTGEPAIFEDTRDGLWFKNRFYPVVENGKIQAVTLCSSDITDTKKAAEEKEHIARLQVEAEVLKKKEQDYLELLNRSTEASWIYDFNTKKIEYSSEWKKRIGELETLENNFTYGLVHPDDAERIVRERNERVKAQQSEYMTEYRLNTIDRGYIWVLDQGKIVYDEHGAADKIYGTSMDITDRKKTEEILQKGASLLRAVIEGATDSIYLKDREGRFIIANSATSKATGLAVAEIIGKTASDIYKDQDIALSIRKNDQHVFCSNSAISFEETVPTPEGVKTFLSNKTPWHDAQGNVIGIIGISRDITDRNGIMEMLKNTAVELEQKNRLITDFFINISHEFKTPITMLQLAIELVEHNIKKSDLDFESLYKHLDIMRGNSYRLLKLVGNLLDITKIDAGFMTPNWEYTDIVALLKKLVKSIKIYTARKGIKLRFMCNVKSKQMQIDIQLLDRIILNLVSNSIKHTHKGGLIYVGCEDLGDNVLISVKDNGNGIPDPKKEIIFDRFRQANNSLARSNEGCGIGLSLTKSLVELLGGKIWFKSIEGKGSDFFFEVPAKCNKNQTKSIVVPSSKLENRVRMEFSDISFDSY